jgi:prepilin-type N-terminal cleavage/methylation domain-containing protein
MRGTSKSVSARCSRADRAQRGFSMPELVAVMAAIGAVLTPVLSAVDSSVESIHTEQSKVVMTTAREALVRYAAQNKGCLPFAADWEGGLPNTDQIGAVGYTDTGVPVTDAHSGDLPWNELGLSATFRDGDGLRIQYYVASQYADVGGGCSARSIGTPWNPSVTYEGTAADPVYVYDTPSGVNSGGLYTIDGELSAGTRPEAGGFDDSGSDYLPDGLLELRRGPDIKGNGDQDDVLSAQNIFVLIAAGDNININSSVLLPYMRDDNHRSKASGAPWSLNQSVVDDVVFSATHNRHGTDESKDGDDMVLAVSFLSFKSDLRTFGVSLAPVCDGAC